MGNMNSNAIWQIARPTERLYLPPGEARRFIVSVDTEEEFDWSAPFNRASTQTSALDALPDAVKKFKAFGVKLALLCDWPILQNQRSRDLIAEMQLSGACEIGAHLHPWVTPPHDETVSHHNSFAGNLPEELQWQKLVALTNLIVETTKAPPIVFRAGRYGLGTTTHAMLAKLGYQFDVSVRPLFNYSGEGGPDFSAHPAWPWRTPEGLIEIPLSTTRIGLLRDMNNLPQWPGMSLLRQRVPLTPEGTPLRQAIAAIRRLHSDGQEIFSLSFHSPSLATGHTSYVKDKADLAVFWHWWDGVLNEFARLGVKGATHAKLLPLLNRAA
jgi:hypothetical protein